MVPNARSATETLELLGMQLQDVLDGQEYRIERLNIHLANLRKVPA